MRDIIIIGAGAAGLAAAAYVQDTRLDYLVLSQNSGGKVGWQRRVGPGAPAYSIGEAAARILEDAVHDQPSHVMHDVVTSVACTNGIFHVATARHGLQQSKTVLIATGVTPQPLEVPGVEHLLGYGLGYSVVTHAHLVAGQTVALIGATARACRDVAMLARTAAHVYWIGEGINNLLKANDTAAADMPNVDVLDGFTVTAIEGTFHVSGVVVERAGMQRQLSVDAAFIDGELRPNLDFLHCPARTDSNGFIWVDEAGVTSEPGLFAAGDATTAIGEHILVALGQGARAAASAYRSILAQQSVGAR